MRSKTVEGYIRKKTLFGMDFAMAALSVHIVVGITLDRQLLPISFSLNWVPRLPKLSAIQIIQMKGVFKGVNVSFK